MFIVQTVKERKITAIDIRRMLTNIAPRSGYITLKLVNTYLQTRRNGALNELKAPFQIVTNGWGELKHVKMRQTGRLFDAETIFRQMQKDEENGCTITTVRV